MGNCAKRCNHELRIRLFVIILISFFFFISVSSAEQPGELCDLVGSIQVDGSNEIISCIDFTVHDGDTLSIPGSISSISNVGLALCPLIDVDVINTDIMYVLDQSQSMPTKTVIYYTDKGDTIYSYNGPKNLDKESKEDIEIIWGTGTKEVPYFEDAYQKSSGQNPRYAGDPYGQSAIALHKTLDYQHAISPLSTAGFTGLHKFAAHKVEPRILTNANLQNLKDSIFIDDYEGRTEFYPSLLVAKNWLLNKDICNNEKQMIIFISDGAPTDKIEEDQNGNNVKKYLQLLDEKHDSAQGVMPPIYGIFLGREGTTNYQKLEQLSDTTGGEFYIVPPDKPDSLVGVLKSIIEKTVESPPLDIEITNESIIPMQKSKVDKSQLKQQVDGSWLLVLDSTIELKYGYNDIRVEINKTNKEGIKETLLHHLTLHVKDDHTIDTLFDEKCYDMASLYLEDSKGIKTDTLTDTDTMCHFYFNHYALHALESFTLQVTSLVTGDNESYVIQKRDSIQNAPAERLIMKKHFQFHSNDTAQTTSGNGIIETTARDTLVAIWKNPRNSKDTLCDTFFVKGEQISYEILKAEIFDRDENGAAETIEVTFNRPIPTLFKTKTFYWNSTADSCKREKADAENIIDSTRIEYQFNSNSFLKGLTGITESDSNKHPKVLYNKIQKYKLQDTSIVLLDKVGAIPTHARRKNSHPLSAEPDTFTIQYSEPLMHELDTVNFNELLRIVEPSDISPNEFEMYARTTLIDLSTKKYASLQSNQCGISMLLPKSIKTSRNSRIFLNRNKDTKDRESNSASRVSVPLIETGRLYFTDTSFNTVIDTTSPKVEKKIVANFKGTSFTDQKDTITLHLHTTDSDSLESKMIETASNSGIYIAFIPIAYVHKINPQNNILESSYYDIFTNDTSHAFGRIEWEDEIIEDSLVFLYKGEPIIEEPKLYVKNCNDIKTDTITHEDQLFSIYLDLYKKVQQDTFQICIESFKHSDKECIILTKDDSVHTNDTLRILLTQTISHHCSDITAPTQNNGIMETSSDDTLYLSWSNPKDTTISLQRKVIIQGVKETISPTNATIYDINEDGAADQIEILFDTLLPALFTIDKAYWNKVAPECERTPAIIAKSSQKSMSYTFNSKPFPDNITAYAPNSNTAKVVFSKAQTFPLSNETITLKDGVGPVPITAEIRGASPVTLSPDTLVVTLSEQTRLSTSKDISQGIILHTTSGPDLFEQYGKATHFTDVEALSLSNKGTTITQLLTQRTPEKYAEKWICIDTTTLVDALQNRVARKSIPISYSGSLYFTSLNMTTAKDTFNTNSENLIEAHLIGQSITDQRDTLKLQLKSDKNDLEIFYLVEENPLSGNYKARIAIGFGEEVVQSNGILEGVHISPYMNDTTQCLGTVTLQNQLKSAELYLTYTGLSELFVTNNEEIRTKSLTDIDSLFTVNFNSSRDLCAETYSVQIRTAEHNDSETFLLQKEQHIAIEKSSAERIHLQYTTGFLSSDITRPTVQNGTVETSANDTVFISSTDQQLGTIYYDTLIVTGTPIIFYPISATILDTNENGIGDKLTVTYNHPIPEPIFYKSLYWNSTSSTPITALQSISTTNNSNELTWIESSIIQTGIPSTVLLEEQPQLNLISHDFLKFSSLTTKITDGIGAVPLTATLLCSHRGTSEPDTLIVHCSEEIQETTILTASPLRSCFPHEVVDPLSPISGYESSIEIPALLKPQLSLHDSDITLLTRKELPQLSKESFIFLSKESGYTDKYKNPHSRKRVPLKRYEKLYFSLPSAPDSAITFAEWPNEMTLLATLPVESTDDALIEHIILTLSLPSGDLETLTMTESSPTSGIFRAQFSYAFTNQPLPENGTIEAIFSDQDIEDSDTLIALTTTLDGITSTTVLPLHYNAPPRIKKALYYPSALNATTPDTLRLQVNVPVIWPLQPSVFTEHIFDYWNGLQTGTDAITSELLQSKIQSTSYGAEILVPRANELTPLLDSIRFTAQCSSLVSTKGISPMFATYVPIEYGAKPPIEVQVVPNPFTPGLSVIPELFRTYVPNAPLHGTAVRVRSRLLLANANFTILDPLNNVLVENTPLFYGPTKHTLYGTWSGSSERRKKVGDGAYLMLLQIQDTYGDIYEVQKLIGVKEPYVPKYTFPWNH